MEAMNKLLEETWGDLPAENDGEPPHIAPPERQAGDKGKFEIHFVGDKYKEQVGLQDGQGVKFHTKDGRWLYAYDGDSHVGGKLDKEAEKMYSDEQKQQMVWKIKFAEDLWHLYW